MARTTFIISVEIDYDQYGDTNKELLTTIHEMIDGRKDVWIRDVEDFVQTAMDNDTPYEVNSIDICIPNISIDTKFDEVVV